MGVVLYIGLNCMMVTSFSDPRTVQGGYMVQFIVCVSFMCVHRVLLMSSHKVLSGFSCRHVHIYHNVRAYAEISLPHTPDRTL